ncbi:hypothetical protein FOS14_16290 [Skermania sp. ID1734]|uniref:hypothetical protein n=1 Tax=Skermania sp. ID1734 TaxID=2597516 RepID=UPI00117EE87B|nr:hypothetical protein [Skermania sp. ID1734]TSD96609.1 hypothetical protein FOS14_16290 [Skermania sp. ID1734]
MDLDAVADELYGLDPSEFVAARSAKVAEARGAGDRQLATAIGKLRKPTVVAWLINLIAREYPKDVAALLQLGGALRDAQRHLSGDQLRELTVQRQQVVRALARKATQLGERRGHEVSEGALREIGQTFHAALADPEVAEQVQRGRLVTALSYSGFGSPGLAAVADEPPHEQASAAEDGLVATAQRELADAERAARDAEEAATAARTKAEEAAAKLQDLEDRINSLRAELDQVEQECKFATSTQKSAAAEAAEADAEFQRRQKRVVKLRTVLDALIEDE